MIRPFPLFALFSFLVFHTGYGQLFSAHNYPQQYFQWPAGAKVGIVANFGELRPNHYHMGLDVRTDGRVNVPVYAAAEGYVAKVHIDPTGFGRALYINHPNGLTTLYAHLNDFNPALEKYVEEQQYKLKQWKIDLELPDGLFPVEKGQFIAYSGNTGGSQGPHVHFEIRETKTDKVLNPLFFGFHIPDQTPPDIIRLAVYDRRKSTYEQTPRLFPLKKVNGIYQPIGGNITVSSDKVSFAISAFDRYSGSTNQNGIFSAVVYDNDKALAGFEMNSVSYDETRTLNGHIDYKTKIHGGPFLQHVSPLPGCMDVIYNTAPHEDGVIRLNNTEPHRIKIAVRDVADNLSQIQFQLQRTDILSAVGTPAPGQLFEPNSINIFEAERLSFYMPENCLFDSFHFRWTQNGNKVMLQGDEVPVNSYYPIRLKADFDMADTGKIVMKMTAYKKDRFKKAVYENGWYKASFRDFGYAELIKDVTPPSVATLFGFRDGISLRVNRIAFAATDNTKEIAEFSGWLDGQWLLFSNDKGTNFIYTVDKYCQPGEHNLRLIVKDLAGNVTEKNYHFYR